MNRQEEMSWRWLELQKLQEHYADFRDFYADCSEELLGFTPSDMQYDIAMYVEKGPMYCMVQAQRGQAKTTITGCYGVWCLIHDPTMRVLILSAGSKMAKQISTWCIQIINTMDCLEILRCDTSYPGARASVEAYDVHWMLKGADKSPSIACLGVTAAMQGYRADLLIADDIESSKNSLTELMREQLRHLTLDFTSINSLGKILYLGTPQTTDSIYNGLPSRGFTVRIWPGRYPTPEEEEVYGEYLAPYVRIRLDKDPSLGTGGGVLGEQGQPTDPVMMDEETLTKKQLDQGKAYFNLQFMLNTDLMDSDRYPLKLNHVMFYDFDNDECPGKFIWSNSADNMLTFPAGSLLPKERIFQPAKADEEYFFYTTRLMSIDPAGGGQNGDETGVSIIYECNGNLIAKWVTGVPGGTSPDKFDKIIKLIQEYKVNLILVEKNYGNGAYAEALKGAMLARDVACPMEEVWSAGQKELRIIDALEPVIGSHKLMIDKRVLQHDVESTQKYPVEKRSSYQLLFQLARITRTKDALMHDDRLESLSQGCTFLIKRISINADHAIAKKKQQKLEAFQKDPYGVWRHSFTNNRAIQRQIRTTAMDRFKIKRKH
jgi:hypothetical protein